MPDYFREQEDRDRELLIRACSAIDFCAEKMKGWIEQEARALLHLTQTEGAVAPAVIRSDVDEAERFLKDVNLRQSPEAFKRYRERREEVEGGLYDDPVKSIQYLVETVTGLERVMHQLMDLRGRLSGLVPGGTSDSQEDGLDADSWNIQR